METQNDALLGRVLRDLIDHAPAGVHLQRKTRGGEVWYHASMADAGALTVYSTTDESLETALAELCQLFAETVIG